MSTKQPATTGAATNFNGATSGTLTGASPIRNSVIDTSSFTAHSGRTFTQVLWTATAHNTTTSSDTAPHHNDKLGRVDLTYVVNRQLSINGGGGLQIINDNALTTSTSGPIWSMGTTYRPGPRLTLNAAYNSQFNTQFFTYSGTYNVSPRTTLSFDHSETVTTTTQLLAQRLPVLGPDGVFRDPVTGLPVDPLVAPPGLQNDTLLQKTWSATASSTSGRNRYSLRVNRSESTVERTVQVTTQSGVVVTYARTLTHRLNGSVSTNYSRSDTAGGLGSAATPLAGVTATTVNGASTNILLSSTLGYTLTKETALNFNVNYSAFDGGSKSLNTHEKSASISLRRTF